MLELALRPHGPYSVRLSSTLRTDATRRVRDGLLEAVVVAEGAPERVQAWQRPDGTVHLRARTDAGLDRLRFVLGLDDDHSEFLRRFRDDPMLGRATKHLAGLRPLRVPTVALALLRALCGQLVDWRRARELERRVIRAVAPPQDGLHAPPTTAELARFSAAELRALGLHARRAATLVRLCRSVDLERLHDLPTDAAAERLLREPGLGPWSVGVVCLEGLGRNERGLEGDLGLIKLLSALRGRRVDAHETRELLAPYGEWAGLASLYLLEGWKRGLLPVPPLARRRPPAHLAA